jgi:uncharacterized protein (TIGR03435 family)
MAHRIAPPAQTDLDDIWYYTAKVSGSLEIANRLIDSITDGFHRLAGFPYIGRSRDEDFGVGFRSSLEAPGTTLEGLADLLTILISGGQPVTDMTGLKGRYQGVLDIPTVRVGEILEQARAAGADPNADLAIAIQNTWQTALQKVGLRLEPRKGPVDTLVVDHLEQAPTEN